MTSLPTTPAPDDAEDLSALLSDARQGERAALDAIVDRCYERVRRAVHLRLEHRFRNNRWNPAAFSTGDVVHGVFLKVLSSPLQLERATQANLIGYLVKAIENHIVDTMRFHQASRRDVRREEGRRDDAADPVAQLASRCGTPSRAVRGNEEIAIYADILASFDEKERRLLKLRLEHESSFDDIAQKLGYKTADVARKAFHAAKTRLLMRLRSRGVDSASSERLDRG